MRGAVYNSAIPQIILNTVNRALRTALPCLSQLVFILILGLTILVLTTAARAADWNVPEEQLARKIAAVTGPGAVAFSVENRSSLGKRDQDIIQNGLSSALEGLGLRFVKPEQAAATVNVSLSESVASYVWVAEIHQGVGESAVVMVSTPRGEGSTAVRDPVPLSLRKIPLWLQSDPILDVAVLEESASPTHIAVLGPEKVSLYQLQNGKWQQEQALEISHSRPWPRDLRGRLIPARDHLLDVFLPGVICRSPAASPLTLNCRESDDPWPLTPGPGAGQTNSASTVFPQMKAFFAPTRNFFTGVLTPGIGKFNTVPKFYSAAMLPRDKYTLWLFAATDGLLHMIDGVSDQTAKLGWGSELTSVKTSCGAGWQVLATTSTSDGADSVRAYEFPDRDPVAVSAAIELPGTITALWTEARGDTAVAVARNRETGSYEALRLALACGQ